MKIAVLAVSSFFSFVCWGQTTLTCKGIEKRDLKITAQMEGRSGLIRYEFESREGRLTSGIGRMELKLPPEETNGTYLWEVPPASDHAALSLAIPSYLIKSKFNGITADIKIYFNTDDTGFDWSARMSCQIRQESLFL